LLAATAQNVKRLVRFLTEQPPKLMGLAARRLEGFGRAYG
jgi:hypothetical protein